MNVIRTEEIKLEYLLLPINLKNYFDEEKNNIIGSLIGLYYSKLLTIIDIKSRDFKNFSQISIIVVFSYN